MSIKIQKNMERLSLSSIQTAYKYLADAAVHVMKAVIKLHLLRKKETK